MVEKEILHKEIDLIQEIIKRMSNNSFLLKGWYITVLSALLLVTKTSLNEHFDTSLWVVIIAPVLFWLLDAYYLGQEALFRKLYEWLVRERLNGGSTHLYDLRAAERFGGLAKPMLKAFFSPTMLVFYAIPTIVLVVLIIKAK